MTSAVTTSAVFDAIQQVKAGAPAFCTNFFPVQRKLEEWIEHGELTLEVRDGAAFFFRRDRDFEHLYFCAADPGTLQRELAAFPDAVARRLVTDVVGNAEALRGVMDALSGAGFQPYSRLQRMTRTGRPEMPPATAGEAEVVWAEKSDAPAVLALLEGAFDVLADQLPLQREIEAAIAAQQILTVKSGGTVAALLFFETQGFASSVRYWAVDARFRAQRLGSALMRRYLELHGTVRRFTLWVVADNRNAIEKYQHYGYAADGLVDHVLANELIRQ